ncbi:YtxH domain-containing protein [Cnuibacter sp. UC19_7]|uniref:YtxH domain-containing protein n=1 Tax=Cnuibacter sp. UC19_7 TaxID=3350166 RepID=UPI00367224CC
MRGKAIFVVGLATGYVLGTRAGRRRYEQIKSGAQRVWNTPVVQKGVGVAEDFASARVDQLKDIAGDAAKKALGSLLGKQPYTEPSQSSSSSASSKAVPSKPPASKSSSTRSSTSSRSKAAPAGGKTPPVEPLAPSTDI